MRGNLQNVSDALVLSFKTPENAGDADDAARREHGIGPFTGCRTHLITENAKKAESDLTNALE